MHDLAIEAATRADIPMLVIVIITIIVSSVLSGMRFNIGWMGAAMKQAELVKALQDIDENGDMRHEIDAVKLSLRTRTRKALRKRGLSENAKFLLKWRATHFAMCLAFIILYQAVKALAMGIDSIGFANLGLLLGFLACYEVAMTIGLLVIDRWDVDSKAEG